MKKSFILALVSFLFLSLNLGCADGGGKSRRARIQSVTTKIQPAEQPESGQQQGEGAETPAPGETQIDPPASDQLAADDILKHFEALRMTGEITDITELKDTQLVLEEVTLLVNSTPSTLEESSYTALYRTAVTTEDGEFIFTSKENDTLKSGQALNADLLALPLFVQASLNKDLLEDNASYLVLKPVIKNNFLSLEVQQLADAQALGDKALESTLDLLEMNNDAANAENLVESPKTKAQIFTEIKKQEGKLELLIEARVSENETQTFLLLYKFEKALAN